MARDDKTCIVCRTRYKYCNACRQYNPNETWRNLYCSDNCRQLYHIYDAIRAKKLSDEEAGEKIAKYDTDNLASFNEPIKSVLMVAKNSAKKKDKPVIEEKQEIADEKPVSEEKPKKQVNRRRKPKKD